LLIVALVETNERLEHDLAAMRLALADIAADFALLKHTFRKTVSELSALRIREQRRRLQASREAA
jgi:hypothetical protein